MQTWLCIIELSSERFQFISTSNCSILCCSSYSFTYQKSLKNYYPRTRTEIFLEVSISGSWALKLVIIILRLYNSSSLISMEILTCKTPQNILMLLSCIYKLSPSTNWRCEGTTNCLKEGGCKNSFPPLYKAGARLNQSAN